MSLREVIMLLMTSQDDVKKNLFTTVVQGTTGTVLGIFSSVNSEINDIISNISHIIAPQCYYKLFRMGCKSKDIKKFLRKVFTADQVSNVSHSKYDKMTGLAKVSDAHVEDIISAAIKMGIDTSLGLSRSQLKERKEALEYDARAITFGQAKDGDLIAIDVNEEQSMTTLNTKKSQARSIAENTLGNTVISMGTNFEYYSEDEDGSDDEKNNTGGKMIIEGLDMVISHGDKREGHNDEMLDEQSKKTATEDLEHKMEIARREDKIMDSDDDDDEFMDAWDTEEEDKGDVDEFSSEQNKDDLRYEAELLNWEMELDEMKDAGPVKRVTADSVQSEIFNVAGPQFINMESESKRIMLEIKSMGKGNRRNEDKLSDTMMQLLTEEVEDPHDLEAMYERMEEIRASYELLHKEETVNIYKSRNDIIEEANAAQSDDGSAKLNEDEVTNGANEATIVNRSDDWNEKGNGSLQGANDDGNNELGEDSSIQVVKAEENNNDDEGGSLQGGNDYRIKEHDTDESIQSTNEDEKNQYVKGGTEDEEDDDGGNEDDDEDDEDDDYVDNEDEDEDVDECDETPAASKFSEEAETKTPPSALRSNKMRRWQSKAQNNLKKDNNELDEQQTQACKTQSEDTLTVSRAKND